MIKTYIAHSCDETEFAYDAESGDLVHYGVVGMKWGVRKMQNAANTAIAKNRTAGNPYSTGENYNKVNSQFTKKRDEAYKKKYGKTPSKALDELMDDYIESMTSGDTAGFAKRNAEYNERYHKVTMDVLNKMSSDFNRAVLKDIGYDDIELGMEILRKTKSNIWNHEV